MDGVPAREVLPGFYSDAMRKLRVGGVGCCTQSLYIPLGDDEGGEVEGQVVEPAADGRLLGARSTVAEAVVVTLAALEGSVDEEAQKVLFRGTAQSFTASSWRSRTTTSGSTPQGSKAVSGLRFTQAAFRPTLFAPITSNGLLETNHTSEGGLSSLRQR